MRIDVKDLADERLDVFAKLTDVQLRSRLEPERAVLIAESAKVAQRAIAAGLEPLSLLVAESRSSRAQRLMADLEDEYPELPVFVLPDEEAEKLIGFELTRGELLACRRPELPLAERLLEKSRRVAVLEGITNHSNVGAIFRSAAAIGVDALFVTPDCYDPFYRRAIRVSMGAVFQVPWTRVESSGAAFCNTLRNFGFTTAAMALREDAVRLGEFDFHGIERLALFFGTEGDGLVQSTIDACDMSVMIPMQHDVDSLNVAAASAVAFWETRPKS